MSFLAERAKTGLSQRKVAEALGITDAAVCLWETGRTRPRAALMVKLSDLYGCTVDELLREPNKASTDQTEK